MRLDPFSNPVFSDTDLFKALYQGHELSSEMFVDRNSEVNSLLTTSGLQCWLPLDEYDISVEEYDAAMQADWHMPDEYKILDIEGFLVSQCPKENYQRLIDELGAFKERDMYNLLRWLKYFVDTCTEKNIVWGIGRGSSVASYVLYLIGVHSVDSVKYNLDWQEFLR
jgi:hypothetical protein